MIKKSLHLLSLSLLAIAFSQPAQAFVIPPGQNVPDGGATALLLGVSAAGLLGFRRFISKR